MARKTWRCVLRHSRAAAAADANGSFDTVGPPAHPTKGEGCDDEAHRPRSVHSIAAATSTAAPRILYTPRSVVRELNTAQLYGLSSVGLSPIGSTTASASTASA